MGRQKLECLFRASHLSTQVDNAGIGVIEGQQNSVAGIHLLNTYRLIHVFLETQNSGFAAILKCGKPELYHTQSTNLYYLLMCSMHHTYLTYS